MGNPVEAMLGRELSDAAAHMGQGLAIAALTWLSADGLPEDEDARRRELCIRMATVLGALYQMGERGVRWDTFKSLAERESSTLH